MATVYHVTAETFIDSIQQTGLQPELYGADRFDTNNDWGKTEQKIEQAIPRYLQDIGLSRRAVTFAHTDERSALTHYQEVTGADATRDIRLAILALDVDSKTSFVADAALLGVICKDRYWNSVITLDQLLHQYELYGAVSWRKIPRASALSWNQIPETYMFPEVLVPGGVAPERIAVHSLSRYPILSNKQWTFGPKK